jgi:hypothetical protein
MSKLDPRIEAVRAKYDLDTNDFWQIPQNKQWVCKHAALEVVATKANVEWCDPMIIQADTAAGIAVMSVTGKMGNRVEWATGEASPKNNKNSYPWAMAEKRAKDRVVLKLVGIHGLVYSEDEMPTTGETDIQPVKSSAQLKRDGEWERVSGELENDLLDCHSLVALEKLKEDYRPKVNGWTAAWKNALKDLFDAHEDKLIKAREKEEADNDFPGNTNIRNSAGRQLHTMEGA